MKIGITGGAGFIGSNLAEALLAQNHEIFVLDNLSSGFQINISNLDVKLHVGNLVDESFVHEFFRSNKIEACFHLAAMGSVPKSVDNPIESFNSNVLATFNVLKEIKKFQIPLIFSSSSSVYGKNPKLPKNEFDWQAPISPYAGYKASAESILQGFAASYNLDIKIFRLFNVFGPKQNPKGDYPAVIARWIYDAINQNQVIVYGDGTQIRDFTFVGDVVDILVKSLETKIEDNMPVNLAFGKSVSLLQVLNLIKENFNDVSIKFESARKSDIKSSQSDPKRFYEYFSKFKATSFESGFIKTINWYKNNKNFY